MKLQDMRIKRGMTQAELAEKTGISISAIRQYEQGAKRIDYAAAINVYKISKVLHCAVEDILEGV